MFETIAKSPFGTLEKEARVFLFLESLLSQIVHLIEETLKLTRYVWTKLSPHIDKQTARTLLIAMTLLFVYIALILSTLLVFVVAVAVVRAIVY